MELWRTESLQPKRPKVMSARNLAVALGLHVGCFALFWLYSVFHGLFDKEEEIVPIDLTIVVNENLEGKENEPPPLKNPESEKPKPKPPPKPKPKPKEPEKPKELEKIVTNIVERVEKKPPKPEVVKKPEKPKDPEPPKKTAKELREERIRKMRESATVVNKRVQIEVKDAKSGNGRTERQTMSQAEILKHLNEGYRPGTKTQLATSIKQRCLMLIQRALDEKWEKLSPSVGRSGTVYLSVQFSSTGGMINVRLSRSSGDRTSDAAALSVARSVSYIQGLDSEFIAQFRKEALTIRYEVQGR